MLVEVDHRAILCPEMTHPTLTIAHTLLLISLDDETGESLVSDPDKLRFSLCGAVLVELQFAERLIPVRAHQFGIVDGPPLSKTLEWAAEVVGPGPIELEVAISDQLAGWWWKGSMTKALLEDLVSLGVVEKKRDRLLVLFYRDRYPLESGTDEETVLRDELVAYASTVTPDSPPSRLDGLLSLLRYMKLLDQALGPELASRAIIEHRTNMVPIGKTIKRVYRKYKISRGESG